MADQNSVTDPATMPDAAPQAGSAWSNLSHGMKTAVVAAVGVAVTAGGVVLPHTDPGNPMDTFHNCSMEGAASQSQWQWTANPQKNRYTIPSAEDVDTSATLDSMMKGKDGTSFDPNKSAEIDGYVTEVKKGGNESCNCAASDPQFMDTHIYIGATKNSPKNQCIIVEVTPRIRAMMAQNNIDWSTPTLISKFTGQHVHVGGWLFFDQEHENASEVNKPGGAHNWRASCWEIHPVTELDIATP